MKNTLTILIIAIMAFVKVSTSAYAQDTVKTESVKQEYQMRNGTIAWVEVYTATQTVSQEKLLLDNVYFPPTLDSAIALGIMKKNGGEVFLNYSPVWPSNPFALFWQTPKIKSDHYWFFDDKWGGRLGEESPIPRYYNWFFIASALILGPVFVRFLVVFFKEKWKELWFFVFTVICSLLYIYNHIPDAYGNGYYGLYISKMDVFDHYVPLVIPYMITIYVGRFLWKAGIRTYNRRTEEENKNFVNNMV